MEESWKSFSGRKIPGCRPVRVEHFRDAGVEHQPAHADAQEKKGKFLRLGHNFT